MSQVARESSSETKIAPRSVRMVVCSGRGSADMGCLQSAWFSNPHNDRADRSPPPIGSTMTPTATCRDSYCHLPLYVFCGRHLLAAKLRRSNIDASAGAGEEGARIVGQIRRRWPKTRILLRGDSCFAREVLMAWCEVNRVDYVFGLARNARLEETVKAELIAATLDSIRSGRPARRFRDFRYATLDSWSRERRVIGKAEVTGDKANPRFIVTSLGSA